jgi:ketosteroid isomerase-like protein
MSTTTPFWMVLLATISVVGCTNSTDKKTHEHPNSTYTTDSTEIREVLDLQLDAWNSGDLEGFVSFYSNDDGMRFITRNGIRTNKDSVLSGYQRSFPTQERMGALDFQILELDSITTHLYGVRGKWVVTRDSTDPSSGLFSLIFKKEKDWRILLDHTW